MSRLFGLVKHQASPPIPGFNKPLRRLIPWLLLACAWWVPATAATLPVRTATLSEVAIYPTREVSAQVQARNQTPLSAEISAKVTDWRADVGARVRRGQTLVRLDASDYQLAAAQADIQVRNARAQRDLAEQQLKRAQSLAAQGFYSTEALNQLSTQLQVWQAQLAAAQVQLRVAKRQLDKTTIRAPFDAEITERQVQLGASVSPGTVLYTLSEVGANQLRAELTPAQAADLSGASALQWVGAGQTVPLSVKQLRISSQLDARTRTQTLRAPLPQHVPAGSAGVLRWRSQQAHIAAEFLVRRAGQLGVFIERDQGARFHALTLAQEGQAAPITLSADTRIVIQGQARLQDGDRLAPNSQP